MMMLTLSETVTVLTHTLDKLDELGKKSEIYKDPDIHKKTETQHAAAETFASIIPEFTAQAGVLVRRIKEHLNDMRNRITPPILQVLIEAAKEDLALLKECQRIENEEQGKLIFHSNGHSHRNGKNPRRKAYGRQIIREKLRILS